MQRTQEVECEQKCATERAIDPQYPSRTRAFARELASLQESSWRMKTVPGAVFDLQCCNQGSIDRAVYYNDAFEYPAYCHRSHPCVGRAILTDHQFTAMSGRKVVLNYDSSGRSSLFAAATPYEKPKLLTCLLVLQGSQFDVPNPCNGGSIPAFCVHGIQSELAGVAVPLRQEQENVKISIEKARH